MRLSAGVELKVRRVPADSSGPTSQTPSCFIFYLRSGLAGITWGSAVTEDGQRLVVHSTDGGVIHIYDKNEVFRWEQVSNVKETIERLHDSEME